MKKIELLKLVLKNFKGIKEMTIDFSKITNIYGENGTGKTTISDGFTWLLFDKDSKDRTVFEIKTLDKEGNVIHGLEHSVEAILLVDGKELTISKTYKEKWTKKRGEAERTLTGHETLYNIDEVPVKKKEFQSKVNDLIDEDLFKLLTNPTYFSLNMKWQDRRKTLLEIIGDVDTEKVINYRNNLGPLIDLLVDKDIDELKRTVVARKRKFNDEIKSIPYRIDECNNSIVEVDFIELENQLNIKLNELKEIEDKLYDLSKVDEVSLKRQEEVFKLKSKLQNIEYQAKLDAEKPRRGLESKISSLEFNIKSNEDKKERLLSEIKYLENDINSIKSEMNDLRELWIDENNKNLEFDDDNFICPTCKRILDPEDIDKKKTELLENFNLNKAKKLKSINEIGVIKKVKLDELETRVFENKTALENLSLTINKHLKEKEQLQDQLKNINIEVVFGKEHGNIMTEISELEMDINNKILNCDIRADLRNEKIIVTKEIDTIKKQLAAKEQNEKLRNRMIELEVEEQKIANQIAQLEGQEFLCEEFIKTKVELLENSINSKFDYVSFKLFDTQVNGGLVETCEALVNGVPFSNANTASQVNAGLDIINALSNQYEVSAPILIDNRESVNDLINTESQVINLIVSKDKNLKIESEEM